MIADPNPHGLLTIANDGPRVTASNYWDGEMSTRGLMYLSANAGEWRLLVPPSAVQWLDDVATAADDPAERRITVYLRAREAAR